MRFVTTENGLNIVRMKLIWIAGRDLILVQTCVRKSLCYLFSNNSAYTLQNFSNHVRLIESLFDWFILDISSILQSVTKM